MKKIIALGICLCMVVLVHAQYETTLVVTDAPSTAVKARMEQNGTKLLTELNNAQGENRNLSLAGININNQAAESLMIMWEVCPFRCDEVEIVERCLHIGNNQGLQVRNIPVIMEPRAGERFDEDQYQEIVLNFDNSGQITNLCFSIAQNLYTQVMRSNLEVTDLRRRSLVLDFVEQFRTAYNRKDMAFLEDIFSDDALIITGTVRKRVNNDGVQFVSGVSYKVQDKRTYLSNLSAVFRRNQRINVVFDDVKVMKHRQKDYIYGVKLVQHWNADTYSDKGYLFLLWDFKDEANPKIHVRTWQPYDATPEKEVFGLNSFNVSKL